MDQTALYSMIKDAGFAVLVFEDYPQFFGNWRADIQHEKKIYEIVSDNREGWLTLWRRDDDKAEKLFETESSKLGQTEELALVHQWLEATKKT
jgi:ribonucleotide reductase beta subunit family protein with ferritin-like domain